MTFAPLKHEGHERDIPVLMRTISWPVVTLVRSIQDLRVTGQNHIPPGPAIYIANHTSHLDGFVIAVALYEAGVPPRFIAKKELFKGALGAALRALGQVELDRDAPGTMVEQMAESLDKGLSIIIFPEGTFTHDPAGWPMRAKTGISRLNELRPNIPIIPISHWGNERIIHQWTGRIRWRMIFTRSEKVLVHIGHPITLTGKDHKERSNSAMTIIAEEVARLRKLLGRPMGDPPAERFVPTELNHHKRRAMIEARKAKRRPWKKLK